MAAVWWVAAEDAAVGQTIDIFVPECGRGGRRSAGGGGMPPAKVLTVRLRDEPATVYNLEVQVKHAYCVTAAGILVHNGKKCAGRLFGAVAFSPNGRQIAATDGRLLVWNLEGVVRA